jgi:hypothetical protein
MASGREVIGKARGHDRRGSTGDARRAGARRRGALAPGLNSVAEPAFEIDFLQKFEYNSTKL